jgi:CDP-paratose 2-epimerase
MTRILISGICGFVGAAIAKYFVQSSDAGSIQIVGFDNFSRAGSWANIDPLQQMGVKLLQADVRSSTDLELLERCDWIIDAAANPSVLAGVDGKSSTRGLIETNLMGTVNLLELCKKWQAGMILLSTSRVYSLESLCKLPLLEKNGAFAFDTASDSPAGVSFQGVNESFSTSSPISLYGATKIASEQLALEYASTFEFPIWINRCGVLAGAGQFAKADQGIFAFWLHCWQSKRSLRYIGFEGSGFQVRDCLHPRDLAELIELQMRHGSDSTQPRIVNVSGGIESARSLRQLSHWCEQRWGAREVIAGKESRQFDVPWLVLDSSLAKSTWGWTPQIGCQTLLEEIAVFSENNPGWIEMSSGMS